MSALPNNVSKQDSNAGPSARKQLALIADASSNNTWVIELDAENRRLLLFKANSSGSIITTAASVEIYLQDLDDFAAAALPTDKAITLRETQGCDADGNAVYFFTLRSKFYSTPFGSDFT